MDMAKYIGETTEYDKKQEVERRKVKSWLKSVSAFANGGGGCLLFGIADDDTIIGLTDAKTDAEFISQKIKERIDPMPQIDLKIERVEDKELLILHVHGGEDTPYYYIGDSVLETFVRIGNESVVADDAIRLLQTSLHSWVIWSVKVRAWAKSSNRLRLFLTLKKRCSQPSSPTVLSLLSRSPI